jgi:TRAP-type C4-dicarboxylate transport system substrate-binding protein
MTQMTRRGAMAGVAAAALIGLRPAHAQAVQLRISTAAADQDWLARAMLRFKEGIERDLPGQFNVSVHANASLFRQGTEVPALQRGNLEMSTMTTFEVEQQIPEYGALSAGYVIRDYPHLRKVLGGPIGQAFTTDVAAKMGIQIVDALYLGTRQMNLRQARQVRTPADLQGVRLRMPPGPGWVALGRGLGVVPTPMAIPEVYLALKNGAIDGQVNPHAITRANNFQEVTQQIVLTRHLIQPVFFAFAKPFWDRLTPPQQEAIRSNARAAAEYNDTSRIGEEGQLEAFFRSAGLRVDTPDIAAFEASVAAQYRESGLAARWGAGLVDRIRDTA